MSYVETLGFRLIAGAARVVAGARALSRRLENSRQSRDEQEQADRAYQAMLNRQQERLDEQERQNASLSESLRALDRERIQQERRSNERYQEMQRRFEQERQAQNAQIDHAVEQMRQETGKLREDTEQLRKETSSRFETLRQERARDLTWTREQLQQSNDRIASLEQQIKNHRELSDYWISQAQRMIADIRDNHRPAHFEPEQWDAVQQTLRNAENDFTAAMYQTAASNGRNAYQTAAALRDSLIGQELEWQQTLEAVRKLEDSLLDNIADAEERTYEIDIDGEKETEDRGVDYWTYGQLSVLRERVEETRSRLNADTDNLTTEQLRSLEQEMADHMTQLSLLENASLANLTMATSRYDMAERIGKVLGDQFLMNDSDGDYFGEQNRDEYHATFTNKDTKETAVVVITPLIGEDGVVVNHAEMIVNTPTNHAEDRKRINDTVVQEVAKQVPDFRLPCSEQYGIETPAEARRTGDISAVSEGNEQVRSKCGQEGITYQGKKYTNPICGQQKEGTH